MTAQLPKGFEALEPFTDDWALATLNERYAKRSKVTAAQLKAFYDAMLPNLEAALNKVDEYPLGEMPEDAEKLFFLTLSMAEISPHIELYGGVTGVPHSFEESRFIAVEGNQRG